MLDCLSSLLVTDVYSSARIDLFAHISLYVELHQGFNTVVELTPIQICGNTPLLMINCGNRWKPTLIIMAVVMLWIIFYHQDVVCYGVYISAWSPQQYIVLEFQYTLKNWYFGEIDGHKIRRFCSIYLARFTLNLLNLVCLGSLTVVVESIQVLSVSFHVSSG